MNHIISKSPDPNNFAGFLVWQVSNKWEKYVNHILKNLNTNQGECFQMITVFQLSKINTEVTQIDIARASGGSIMNTSKILKSLEKKNWIQRAVATDPRAKKITLTELGIQETISIAEVLGKANQEFYGKNQTNELVQTLQNINQNN